MTRTESRAVGAVPDYLRGDGPCGDCGTFDNIVWFTDNVVWNRVMGGLGTMDDPGGIVCIPCFVRRADEAGLYPTGWRLLPEWPWRDAAERTAPAAAIARAVDDIQQVAPDEPSA